MLPDFSYLRERADDIEAIVLTHGHEDHVGALPYVLREIGMPPAIYGGPLTIGLVRSKLEEHKLRDAPLEVLEPGERVAAGPFELEMVHMSHSIPDSAPSPCDDRARDRARDRRLQVRPDARSTASRPTSRGSPSSGARACSACAATRPTPTARASRRRSRASARRCSTRSPAASGRIIVTCFASNVHRVQQVIDAAAQLDRRVALVGRSMRKNFNIASNLGIARRPTGC